MPIELSDPDVMAQIFGAFLAFLTATWVYKDASKRGKTSFSSLIWGLAVFLALIFFLPLWLITRPKIKQKDETPDFEWKPCPSCGKYIKDNPVVCPKCGESLSEEIKVY